MDKEIIPGEERQQPAPEIEFWEDDCGLADLAKDTFAQLRKTAPTKDGDD